MSLVVAPAGISPAGLFVPFIAVTTPAPPPGVLADNVDWNTLEVQSLFHGLHPIDEQVMTALTTVRNSGACVTEVGARFVDVTKLDQNASKRLESEARIALKRLIDRGDIVLLGVEVGTEDDSASVTVRWINRRAPDSKKVRSAAVPSPIYNIAGNLSR